MHNLEDSELYVCWHKSMYLSDNDSETTWHLCCCFFISPGLGFFLSYKKDIQFMWECLCSSRHGDLKSVGIGYSVLQIKGWYVDTHTLPLAIILPSHKAFCNSSSQHLNPEGSKFWRKNKNPRLRKQWLEILKLQFMHRKSCNPVNCTSVLYSNCAMHNQLICCGHQTDRETVMGLLSW